MSEPFLGEIKIFSIVYAPRGWAQCNGQFLPINQNQALFSLLGTTYGGNGQTTFALPDLRGRVPYHTGDGHTLGEAGGAASATLTIGQLPGHIHTLGCSNLSGDTVPPATAATQHNTFAITTQNPYSSGAPAAVMNPGSISSTGGSQAHENRQPFLTLNFCIALTGIFPSQN